MLNHIFCSGVISYAVAGCCSLFFELHNPWYHASMLSCTSMALCCCCCCCSYSYSYSYSCSCSCCSCCCCCRRRHVTRILHVPF
ncbi:hypothetical protein V8C37DRAFT_369688 [Trichoderma ceciliae]